MFLTAGILQERPINLLEITGEKAHRDRGGLRVSIIFVKQVPTLPDRSPNAEIGHELDHFLVLFNVHGPQNRGLNFADVAQCPRDMIVTEDRRGAR